MKIGYKTFYFTVMGTFMVFLMTIFFFSQFSSSYAIPTGVDRSGVPSSTFLSNVTTESKTNYMQNAYGSSSVILNNFAVPTNYRTSNNSTPLYKLMKNLDTPTQSEKFEIIEENPTSITDKGIQYILAHGYNTTNTTRTVFTTGTYGAVTDNNIKEYITQIALWLYIYENKTEFADTYCANGGCDFTSNTSGTLMTSSAIRDLITTCGNKTNYQYLKYITLLVDNAKNYQGRKTSQMASFSSTSFSYQINDDFTLLVTDEVTPSSSSNEDNYLYYSVEVKDPNNYGVYLVDSSNKKITNTNNMSSSFKIAVPLQEKLSDMNLSSIEIQIYGHFVRDDGYSYRVTSSTNSLLNDDKKPRYAEVLYGYTPSEVVGTSFTLYNFVEISKVDITNSKEIPGATLELKKKDQADDDDFGETWVSTNKPHYIYLDDGEYMLCETIPPTGYILNTECVNFEVDNSHIVSVEMKNEPYIPTPPTGLFQSKIIYFIGFLLTITGVIWTYYVAIKHSDKL